MKKLIIISLFSLVTRIGFADEFGIPYNLSCSGKSSVPGLKISLTTSTEAEEGMTLVRAVRRENGSPAAGAVSFKVKSIGPRGGQFHVSAVGLVKFAGSGSLTANLLFNEETRKGTWTETMSTFDESKGVRVNKTTKYNVTCSLVQ